MIFLSAIPELTQLFSVWLLLIFLMLKRDHIHGFFSSILVINFFALFYFLFRTDLHQFQDLHSFFTSDGLSLSGRLAVWWVSILMLSVVAFQNRQTADQKARISLFVILFSISVSILFQAQQPSIFLGLFFSAWICTHQIASLTAVSYSEYLPSIQKEWPAWVLIFVFIALGEFVKPIVDSTPILKVLPSLVMTLGLLLLSRTRQDAGFSQPLRPLVLFSALVLVWLRFGMVEIQKLPDEAQSIVRLFILLALLMFAIEHALRAWCVEFESDSWVSSLFSSLWMTLGLGFLFQSEFPVEIFSVTFVSLGIVGIFTGSVFQRGRLQPVWLRSLAAVGLVGLAPLSLAEALFRVMRGLEDSGHYLAGFGVVVLWVIWWGAVSHQLRLGFVDRLWMKSQRPTSTGDVVFAGAMLLSLLFLTVFRPALIELFRNHSPLMLW